MTFHNASEMYPGQLYPNREPPPQIPKNHTAWMAVGLFGSVLLIVLGLIVGFWRAASVPVPRIDTPVLESPPPEQTPSPK